MSSAGKRYEGDADHESSALAQYIGAVPSVGISFELARVELKRSLRWVRAQDFWLLYGLVSAVGLLLGSSFAFDSGKDVGAALAAGESTWLTSTGTWMLWSVVWLFVTVLVAVDAIGSNGDVDNDSHYLTIRPAADIAGGKLLAAAAKFSAFVFVPVLAGYAGIAAGSETFTPVVGGLLAATVTVGSATAVGYPVGLVLKGVIRHSKLLTRLKPMLAVAAAAVYVVVMTTGEVTTVVERLKPVLTAPPLGWLGDLALVTTAGADASAVGALAGLAATTLVTLAGAVLVVPAAQYAWRADRMLSGDGDARANVEPPEHRFDEFVGSVIRHPATRSVTTTTLLRIYRSPLQLVFVVVPLVGAIPTAEGLLKTGTLPWYAPWLAVWYGSWAAGAAVPLNPLGNQGSSLPSLLTSPADGRHVIRGNVAAAVLPVAPVVTALAVGLGHVEGRTESELLFVGVASVAAVVAAAVLAAGIGTVFPRFDAVDLAGSRRAVPPSKSAYTVFSTVLTLTVASGAVVADEFARTAGALLVSKRLPFGLEVDESGLTVAAWVVLGLAAVSIPLAYRVAVRRVDEYRLS